jgi:hypothetical protein
MGMRVSRIVLALLGLAGLGYGALLGVRFTLRSFGDGRSAAAFFIGGPVVHDAVVAPLVGVVGLLISRWVGRNWRVPVRVGAAVSGVLVLLAVPALWRAYAGQANPGLDDRNYGLGLGLFLVAVWFVVLVAGLVRTWRARGGGDGLTRPRTPRVNPPDPPVVDGSSVDGNRLPAQGDGDVRSVAEG